MHVRVGRQEPAGAPSHMVYAFQGRGQCPGVRGVADTHRRLAQSLFRRGREWRSREDSRAAPLSGEGARKVTAEEATTHDEDGIVALVPALAPIQPPRHRRTLDLA